MTTKYETHPCHDCDEPAVIPYRDIEGTIWLCRPCYDDRLAAEREPEPDHDALTAREQQIRTYEQKYYGKGL